VGANGRGHGGANGSGHLTVPSIERHATHSPYSMLAGSIQCFSGI
jgi:hypothetical protein